MDVMDVIRRRRSVRKYANRAIPPEIVQTLKEALRMAPSACNYQPWSFIFVTEPGLRKGLAEASHRQSFLADAPIIVVGVGHVDQAYKRMGGQGNSAEIDVAIALDHLTLAAAAEGLGTCWIGAFVEDEVKKLLEIPAKDRVVAMLPLGYPADPGMLHEPESGSRKPPEEVFCNEKFPYHATS